MFPLKFTNSRGSSFPVVYSAHNKFLKGLCSKTNSKARIYVAIVALTVGLFLLKSALSTAFFVLAMMGAIYFIFITLNKDETTTEKTLEEARRIMDKYK